MHAKCWRVFLCCWSTRDVSQVAGGGFPASGHRPSGSVGCRPRAHRTRAAFPGGELGEVELRLHTVRHTRVSGASRVGRPFAAPPSSAKLRVFAIRVRPSGVAGGANRKLSVVPATPCGGTELTRVIVRLAYHRIRFGMPLARAGAATLRYRAALEVRSRWPQTRRATPPRSARGGIG